MNRIMVFLFKKISALSHGNNYLVLCLTFSLFPIPPETHSTLVRWSLWACAISPAFCPGSDQSQPYPSSALPSSLSSVDKPEASAPDTRHLWLVSDRVVCPGCPLQHHLHPFTSVVPKRGGEHSSGCVWLCLCLRGPRFPVSGEIVLCCHLLVYIGTATPNPETCLSVHFSEA